MTEFTLDTSGAIDLDEFTQGYVEAMFFTSTGVADDEDLEDATFSDLAPETLTAILHDCRAFQSPDNLKHITTAEQTGMKRPSLRTAGMDFYYSRHGHGCGFWDGDWPEPQASELDKCARVFPSKDLYRGDDGMLYLA